MTSLIHWQTRPTEKGYGKEGILLGRVFSIRVEREKAEVIFTEECDGYFTAIITPTQAKQALQEAMDWIDEQMKKP